MKYKIITSLDFLEVEEQVNELLAEGWGLQGGLQVTNITRKSDRQSFLQFSQATINNEGVAPTPPTSSEVAEATPKRTHAEMIAALTPPRSARDDKTWWEIIGDKLMDKEESWVDLEHSSVSEAELNRLSEDDLDFTIWTKKHVYFRGYSERGQYCDAILRNPPTP